MTLRTHGGHPILVGENYKVKAPGTNSREVWTVREIKSDDEILAKGDRTPHIRTFTKEQFVEMNNPKKIISESEEFITNIGGVEMWVERVDWWPPQKRRGRRPKGEAA